MGCTLVHLEEIEKSLRKFAKEIIKRMPVEWCKQERALVPGGGIRVKRNLWMRSAFQHSKLERVPRETRLRGVIFKVMQKTHLGTFDSLCVCLFFFLWGGIEMK